MKKKMAKTNYSVLVCTFGRYSCKNVQGSFFYHIIMVTFEEKGGCEMDTSQRRFMELDS